VTLRADWLTDPKHWRRDLRWLRAAIRERRLTDPADVDLIIQKTREVMQQAGSDPTLAPSIRQRVLSLGAQLLGAVALADRTPAPPGRPRSIFHRSDFTKRLIHADFVRAKIIAAGDDPARVPSVYITIDDRPPVTVALIKRRIPIRGTPRIDFACPICQRPVKILIAGLVDVRCLHCAALTRG
jgi:hypothetical protein